MRTLGLFSPYLLALALLLAQQGGAVHTLRHSLAALSQQQKDQSHVPSDCEQCTNFAQFNSALASGYFSFAPHESLAHAIELNYLLYHTQHTLSATARAPPAFPFLS